MAEQKLDSARAQRIAGQLAADPNVLRRVKHSTEEYRHGRFVRLHELGGSDTGFAASAEGELQDASQMEMETY